MSVANMNKAEMLNNLARVVARDGFVLKNIEPGARLRSRWIMFGIAVTVERQVHDETEHYQVLIPSHTRVRDRSKYSPHQGRRERVRRQVGGFAVPAL